MSIPNVSSTANPVILENVRLISYETRQSAGAIPILLDMNSVTIPLISTLIPSKVLKLLCVI